MTGKTLVKCKTTGKTGRLVGTCEGGAYALVKWDQGGGCAVHWSSLEIMGVAQ